MDLDNDLVQSLSLHPLLSQIHGKDKTYYYTKDILFLSHESVLSVSPSLTKPHHMHGSRGKGASPNR